jgi:AcrR family transcriptional regulator
VTNKEKQRSRVRGYFLQATKDLIASEGISGMTTKKIGDRAGFSYATIYNYFTNLNELLCEAIDELNTDIADSVQRNLEDIEAGQVESSFSSQFSGLEKRIREFTHIMIDYYASNTHLYYPFISTEIDFDYFKKRDGHPFVHPAYRLLHREITKQQLGYELSNDDVRQFSDILMYIFHAKLHFYITYKVPDQRCTLEKEIQDEISFLLRGRFS